MGEQVLKIAAAPLGDNYTGPVLFEGVASPQLLAEVLGRNLHISRKPIAAPGAASAGELDRTRRPPRRPHHAGILRRDRRSHAAACSATKKWTTKACRTSRCRWSRKAC